MEVPMNLEQLVARVAVVDAIVRLFVATDSRDWVAVEGCFAEEVVFDMVSVVGEAPARLAGARIAAGWAEGLAPIEAVHHQAGNFQVEVAGDEATASCYGIALHHRRVASGRNTRAFVGTYDFHLVRDSAGRWRIDLFRFNLKFLDGNHDLHAEATA
jgi:hypothetical protein